MPRWLNAAAALLVSVTGACAGPDTRALRTGMPSPAVQADRARLILYRQGFFPVQSEVRVQIDGKGTCGIAAGEALAWEVAPGPHRIAVFSAASVGTSVLPLEMVAGKTVYVEASTNSERAAASLLAGSWGAWATSDNTSPHGGSLVLEQVASDVGERDVSKMVQAGCPFQGIVPGAAR